MDNLIFNTSLIFHIIAGTITLLSSIVAIASKLTDSAHRWHVLSGRLFFYGMSGIFVTGLIMSLMRWNAPMLFISVFSFYFAWMGRAYARNRKGIPSSFDSILVPVMLFAFATMTAYGFYETYVRQENFGIVIIAFGIIGVLNTWTDWQIIRKGGATGKLRIAEHLGKMLGGTIAAITAFLVVNIDFQPGIVVWLLPTVLLVPVIFIWERKIKQGVKRKGMADV